MAHSFLLEIKGICAAERAIFWNFAQNLNSVDELRVKMVTIGTLLSRKRHFALEATVGGCEHARYEKSKNGEAPLRAMDEPAMRVAVTHTVLHACR